MIQKIHPLPALQRAALHAYVSANMPCQGAARIGRTAVEWRSAMGLKLCAAYLLYRGEGWVRVSRLHILVG